MAAVLQSRPVGALACQKDSYLRTLDAEVISCEKVSLEPKKNRQNGRKDELKATQQDLWQVEFTDSVLFPEGMPNPSHADETITLV